MRNGARRRPIRLALARLLLVVFAAAAAPARAQLDLDPFGLDADPAKDPPAKATLVSERTALVAGSVNWVGIRFELRPGWHIYWPGQNDTGFAPRVRWRVPDGIEIGPLGWPAPSRYTAPGDILDHVYERSVTILVPVTVPPDARGPVTLEAALNWLVCEQICLPGAADVRLTLDVVGPDRTPEASADAALFGAARARLPRSTPKEESRVRFERTGTDVTIRVPGAARIAFYPGVSSAPVAALLRDGAADGDTLRLRVPARRSDDDARFAGVVEAWTASGKTFVLESIGGPREGEP